MRVNMEVVCIHVWKENNEICWNCPKRGVRVDEGEWIEGVNLSKIYCKHICKYHMYSPVQPLYAS
jgi:hypothetical protein